MKFEIRKVVHLVAVAGVSVALVAMLAAGCSNQPEGGRCDLNNNHDDCQSGLTCQKIQGQATALCCPPPPKTSSVAACIPGSSLLTDSGPRPDAEELDAAPQDAQPDVDGQDAQPDVDEQDAQQDVDEQDAPQDSGPEVG